VVGHNLKDLRLHHMEGLDLAEVFVYCPNLSIFRADYVTFLPRNQKPEFWSMISSFHFRRLRKFSTSDLPSGALKFILEAPFIELINLDNPHLGHEDVVAAQNLTTENLQLLEYFFIDQLLDTDISAFYKGIVSCAPRLTNFECTLYEGFDEGWSERQDVLFFKSLTGIEH
jgi:hypothetical protein